MAIAQRLAALRGVMTDERVDAIIINGTDPHQSEYVPERWRTRQWISGFTGSAGTVVVTQDSACLWSDFRYYIQAQAELDAAEFTFFRGGEAGVPSHTEWLGNTLKQGDTVAVNAETISVKQFGALQKRLDAHGITLKATGDLLDTVWDDRPPIPGKPIRDYPIKFAGKSRTEKLSEVRAKLKDKGATHHLIPTLDTIAWLMNIRGQDVKHIPVALAYLLIGPDSATLCVGKGAVSGALAEQLSSDGVDLDDYSAIGTLLKQLPQDAKILVDTAKMAYDLLSKIPKHCRTIEDQSPAELMKCIKNETEVQGMINASKRDCAAMVEFLFWLDTTVPKGGVTELSVAEKLIELRGKDDMFLEPSFPSIAGYLDHGALCHYCADESSSYALKPEGLFLIDSGGQYQDGTTDITRTVALGPLDEQQKKDVTLVLKSHIQLASVIFPEGTSGGQLEVLGKYALWQDTKDYNHGPGHGLGVCLGVHEGPAGFGKGNPTALKPGMILTNEPGLYREGAYGIRIENTVTVVEKDSSEFGKFLGFDTISFCPIDTRAVSVDLLSEDEKTWLNSYHKTTLNTLSPLLSQGANAWLEERCKPIK